MSEDFSAIRVLMATGALLAFVVGIYTLVGRERKAPYISNEAFKIFLVSATGAVADILSFVIPEYKEQLTQIGILFLLTAFVLAIHQSYRILRRFAAFVDSINPKYSWAYQKIKELIRKVRHKKEFEYNATPINNDLFDALKKSIQEAIGGTFETKLRESLGNSSICVALSHHGQSNELLASACVLFLKRGYHVQYMTASRHPIEFLHHLAEKLKTDQTSMAEVAEKITIVDAYTPHFGFLDSVYSKRTLECERDYGVTILPSKLSYAGVHTSCQRAFNKMKKDAKSKVRTPALVIYENMYAISDLESPEQYRIFIRHVLPSEKLWGGMLTIFTEVNPAEGDWSVLSSYASMLIDLRENTSAGCSQDKG